jgi:uncharacterized protein
MHNRNPVFVDTCGWIAILNADDALHQQACEQLSLFGSDERTLLTTDLVVAETGNGLARTKSRDSFANAVQRIMRSPNCRLIRIDASLFDRAIKLYAQASDKSWGLVDCASFILMRDENIVETLSSDRHFLQAGFSCLLPTA